jgi:hypothetical protein
MMHQIMANPWIATFMLGWVTGWEMARRTTRYMLGGRP